MRRSRSSRKHNLSPWQSAWPVTSVKFNSNIFALKFHIILPSNCTKYTLNFQNFRGSMLPDTLRCSHLRRSLGPSPRWFAPYEPALLKWAYLLRLAHSTINSLGVKKLSLLNVVITELEVAPPLARYCTAVYWAVATMTSTGYGDVHGHNLVEMGKGKPRKSARLIEV